MNILIDTQVFVWLIDDDKRIGNNAAKLLGDTRNNVSISYFSFFELTIKASIGKIMFDSSVIDDLPLMGIDLLMPDISTLQSYQIIDATNKDPFDNILIAAAKANGLCLMSSDVKILEISEKTVETISVLM